MTTSQKRDELFAALSVVGLLIGTATGSAIAIMAMSLTLLAIMAVFYRPQMRTGPLLVALVAAVTAVLIAGIVALVPR